MPDALPSKQTVHGLVFTFYSCGSGPERIDVLTNVALRLAQSGHRTLVVDLDFYGTDLSRTLCPSSITCPDGCSVLGIIEALDRESHVGEYSSGGNAVSQVKPIVEIPGTVSGDKHPLHSVGPMHE